MIWQVYTLCHAYHNVATICHHITLLYYIIFPMLYLSSLWLIPSTTGSLYLLPHLYPFCSSSCSPSSSNHEFVLYIYGSVSAFLFDCFVFLDLTNKWNNIVFVFLWLILFSIMPSGSIHVVVDGKISFLLMAELYTHTHTYTYTSISSVSIHHNGHLSCFYIQDVALYDEWQQCQGGRSVRAHSQVNEMNYSNLMISLYVVG